MNYDSVAVLIPAYKPDRRLNTLVDELIEKGFSRIVVIDDGGGEPYADIFRDLSGKAVVLTHEVNRGKGAGLKTGIREIMKTPGVGIVTADADGQHTPDDVAKIADALIAAPDALILGSRDKKVMPPRSKVGNTLTCVVFGLLTGMWIGDTQTGLRGLPASALKAFSDLDGDRYEYEINMLIKASELTMDVKEIEIQTIYIDNNSSSHFNALKDGLKIYKLMFRQAGKFVLSSAIAAFVDQVLFNLLHYAVGAIIPVSKIIARIISSLINYFLNSTMVFGKKATLKSMLRYYALAVVMLACSILGVTLLTKIHCPAWLASIVTDGLLYILSYRVQRGKVFKQ